MQNRHGRTVAPRLNLASPAILYCLQVTHLNGWKKIQKIYLVTWKLHNPQISVPIKKSFIGTQPCLFISLLCMATSVLYGRVEYFRQRPNGLQVRIFTVCYPLQRGFPGGSVVKNQSANAGDVRDVGLIPGLGRSPGVGNGNPLQYSCLKIPMDRGAMWSTDHGVAKSKTQLIDWEHTHTLLKSWPTPGLDGEVLSGCQAQAGGLWSRIAANDKVLKLGVLSGLEGASLVAQTGKNSPAVLETHVQSLGREDPVVKEMATHSIYLPGEFHVQRNLVGCHPWGHKSQAWLSD